MTVVPAQVAGVWQIALAGPPTADGMNEMTLALAGELGIEEVYRIGGAIAIAAFALGTETIPAVQMVAGPGNAFVAEAKMQLCGRVAIDSPAGASEVLIIADETANAAHVAADMLAQAEHNPASAVLVTTWAALAAAVAREIEKQLPALPRAAAASNSLDNYSGIIVVPSLAAACDVANEFAAEHLQIITADNRSVLAQIRNAGAIFLGDDTPVPLGDYVAGPSHVLPTRGLARQYGPLSVNSFLKASSVLEYDPAALAADAADVQAFANYEGLTAHAAAVAIRLSGEPGSQTKRTTKITKNTKGTKNSGKRKRK
jgi:histidinol dehydrogenase